MPSSFVRFTNIGFLLVALSTPTFAEQGLQFKLDGKSRTILPLGYSRSSVVALTQNGYMLDLKPQAIRNPHVVPTFRPFSQSQMRGELLKEFGKSFDVTGTGNYLVVHPKGAKDIWANQFEELYRSMVHFFRTRGYPTSKPRFPLVGVVFYSKSQYLQYCHRVLKSNMSGSLGVYMPSTNRIYLYDATRGQGNKTPAWEDNLATIMHEAAHQTAFNAGIHVRGAETPYWIAEGLGCLFEARGIYNTFRYKRKEDRLNPGRLRAFQQIVKPDAQQIITSAIGSDDLFRRDPSRAYATAWAVTFYLSERQPREYIRYLKLVAKQKPVTKYTTSQRLQDFTKVFGKDFKSLSLRITRYIDALPQSR